MKKNLKIIIPVIVAIVILAIGIVIIKNNTLTKEEQYAVDYLLCNEVLKPNTTKIYKVWVYQEGDKWYFAYDISFPDGLGGGEVELIYGNEEGINIEELKDLKITKLLYKDYNTIAKEKGIKLNEKKISKAFKEQY